MEGNGEASGSASASDLHEPKKPAKPSKGSSRSFVRQRPAGSSDAAPIYSVQQLQGQLIHALSGVGHMAAKLILVLAQPEMDCEELYGMGFASISTCSRFAESFSAADCTPDVSGLIIVNVGEDIQSALDCFRILDRFANAPPSIAVMILQGEETPEGAERELQLVGTLLETGADDTLTCYGKQVISRQRLQEGIVRTEIMARKASLLISHEVDLVKKKMSKSLQGAWARFMWDLPGKVLENIPTMDPSVQERREQNQGVGDYRFSTMLGAGTFGAVFKAEHPQHGTCALKIISKSSIKNVYQLFSVDKELCIMTHLAAHPNIVWGHGALHTQESIILVMSYSGSQNLHNFITQRLKNTTEQALPLDMADRFCKQAAAGLAHLHTSQVCHRDLKPANFIIADEGQTLRLTDFGLAALVLGDQKLLHSCGSLPFAAPEVLRIQMERRAAPSYNGFAADIWSLAVNFVELVYGLYSMDRLLGWVPKPPADGQQRLQDVERFEDMWRHVPEMAIPGMHRVVDNMFRLNPRERWTIGHIVGSDGLGIAEVHRCSMRDCPHSVILKPLRAP